MSEPQGLDQFLNQEQPQQNFAVASKINENEPAGLNDYIKDELVNEKYGTIPQKVTTAVEAAARGFSLGTSDYIAAKLSSPEAVRGREQANPEVSIPFNIAGGAGLIAATGGLAAPLEAGLGAAKIAPLIARGLAFGAEGAAFGAANTVSDLALGDTNVNAEKILMDIGFGAALGSGLGLLSKGLEALPSLRKAAPVVETTMPIEAAPIAEPIPTPKSLKEMQTFNENAPFMGMDFEEPPPKVEALNEAIDRLPDFQAKPTEIHKDNLLGKTQQDRNNALLKASPELEDTWNKFNNNIRQEVNIKTDKALADIAPGHIPTSDIVENGEKVSDILEKQIIDEKAKLVPAFEALKKYEVAEAGSHRLPLIEMFTKTFPKLAEMFDTTGAELKIKPKNAKWGISDEAYKAIKTIVRDSKNIDSIQDLVNLRKEITSKLTHTLSSESSGQLKQLSSAMMEYINDNLQNVLKKIPEGEGILKDGEHIRDYFKRYAINENNRKFIETKFGVDIENGGFKKLAGKPASAILTKIFKDEETVKAIKALLPPEEYNKLLSNYMAQSKDALTKDGVLSSARFGTFLNDKKNIVLNEAFKGMESKLQRVRDLNTISRLVPDLPSGNPSGTGNTTFELLKKLSSPSGIAGLLKDKAFELYNTRAATEELNARLAGRAFQAEKLNVIQKMIEKTGNKIDEAAKSIYGGTFRGGAITGASKAISGDYSERVKKVKELSNDPNAMMNHFDKSTAAMQIAAPNITQSLNQTMVKGLSFLNSKIPQPSTHFVLSKEFKPSAAAQDKFNHYFNIVNAPLSAIQEIKDGNLTTETIEALGSAHPNLYKEMQKAVLSHFDQEAALKLAYPAKLALFKFLGSPLDEHMQPESIIGYQASLSGPQLSQQGIQKDHVTQAGMKNVDLAKNSATKTDRLNEQD